MSANERREKPLWAGPVEVREARRKPEHPAHFTNRYEPRSNEKSNESRSSPNTSPDTIFLVKKQ